VAIDWILFDTHPIRGRVQNEGSWFSLTSSAGRSIRSIDRDLIRSPVPSREMAAHFEALAFRLIATTSTTSTRT